MSDTYDEAALRRAWEHGFDLARRYGDNWPHFQGEQKELQWQVFMSRLHALETSQEAPMKAQDHGYGYGV